MEVFLIRHLIEVVNSCLISPIEGISNITNIFNTDHLKKQFIRFLAVLNT